ncbi:hypothetical protein GCM10027570_50690 [Streptomonospora sediminis]
MTVEAFSAMKRRRAGAAALPAAVLVAVLAPVSGCGAGFPGGESGSADLPGESAEDAAATVNVADETPVGPVVTDAEGYTLYVYTADSADPSESTCTDDCAEQWPPALVEGEVTTDGLDKSAVDRIEHDEGGSQLTLAGWPLYRFSGDVNPGDVNGQGADGTWFAMTPSGERADELPYGQEEGTGGLRSSLRPS